MVFNTYPFPLRAINSCLPYMNSKTAISAVYVGTCAGIFLTLGSVPS